MLAFELYARACRPFLLQQAQITVPASAEADYPALWGAYGTAAKTGDSVLQAYDGGLKASILRYIEASRNMMAELDQRLALQLADVPGVILWGTGQLAMKLLLNDERLSTSHCACVDGNAVNQGKQFAGARCPLSRGGRWPGVSDRNLSVVASAGNAARYRRTRACPTGSCPWQAPAS